MAHPAEAAASAAVDAVKQGSDSSDHQLGAEHCDWGGLGRALQQHFTRPEGHPGPDGSALLHVHLRGYGPDVLGTQHLPCG